MKHLSIAFLIVSLAFLWTLLRLDTLRVKNNSLNNKVKKLTYTLDSVQHLNDSIYSELFPCEIELNRFRIAYEIFLERNPKAASQYGDIISNETE